MLSPDELTETNPLETGVLDSISRKRKDTTTFRIRIISLSSGPRLGAFNLVRKLKTFDAVTDLFIGDA